MIGTDYSNKMKVLMYSPDPNGAPVYSRYLIAALKKEGTQAEFHSTLDGYKNYDIIHIQFEHSVFHPFGLRLIPTLIKLKFNRKKIIITSHTVLARKEIYARNEFFASIKRILLPLDEKLMSLFYDKMIVHTDYSKEILMKDYNIQNKKIGVIPHGAY